VRVLTFCIDATEVTQEAWAACVVRGPCPAMPDDCDAPRGPDYPVVCVSPEAAHEYCRSVGKRLPTEAEWEKAARGGCEIIAPETCGPEDERTYPWGDDPPTCEHANFWPREQPEPCSGTPDVVGVRPSGASPYGALDLAGNVREWVFEPEGDFTPDQSFARGGHFRSSARAIRAASRTIMRRDRTVGFRCAVTP